MMSEYEKLLSDLRSALAHLDEPLRLEKCSLAQCLSYVAAAPAAERGPLLRRTLRRAIESLDPGLGVPADAPQSRPYQVLYRYAVLRQGMVTIAQELDIGDRQAYRELRLALQQLASLLFNEQGTPARDEADTRAGQVRAEVERLSGTHSQEVDLSQLVAGVVASAQGLARERGLEIRLRDEAPGLQAAANRVMLRQALLNLLSHLLRTQGGKLVELHLSRSPVIPDQEGEGKMDRINKIYRITEPYPVNPVNPVHSRPLGDEGEMDRIDKIYRITEPYPVHPVHSRSLSRQEEALIELTYQPTRLRSSAQPEEPYAVAGQLFAAQGLAWQQSQVADGTARITIRIPLAQERSVLIVDDNEGLIRLFRGYLRGQPYRVQGESDPEQALDLIQRLQPDLVILDVMMPGRDGWEILEAIRAADPEHRTRVIVCSIIQDPDLAATLGADAFLHKPVDRAGLLRTMGALLHETSNVKREG